jgi:sugar-specific transcriptional regulator TrmB
LSLENEEIISRRYLINETYPFKSDQSRFFAPKRETFESKQESRERQSLYTSELTEDLISFGLSPLQAEAYIVLLREGRLAASTLAQIINIDRSDAYRVLRALRKQGMLEVELSGKSYYIAVPPEKALSTLLETKAGELNELRDKSKLLCELLQNVERKRDHSVQSQEPFFRLVSGSQVFNRWAEAILSAKFKVVKVIPGYTLPVHFFKLSDIEAEASKRIKVVVVTEVTSQNIATVQEYYRKIKVLHADGLTSGFRYLLIDDSEVFMGGTPMTNSIEDHVVIWTNNKVFVDACMKDFESISQRARDAIQTVAIS